MDEPQDLPPIAAVIITPDRETTRNFERTHQALCELGRHDLAGRLTLRFDLVHGWLIGVTDHGGPLGPAEAAAIEKAASIIDPDAAMVRQDLHDDGTVTLDEYEPGSIV